MPVRSVSELLQSYRRMDGGFQMAVLSVRKPS